MMNKCMIESKKWEKEKGKGIVPAEQYKDLPFVEKTGRGGE